MINEIRIPGRPHVAQPSIATMDTEPTAVVPEPTTTDQESTENLDEQVGGTHYSSCHVQPIYYIMANKLGFNEGNIVKYVTRHENKGGAEDIKKLIQYATFILRYSYGYTTEEIAKFLATL